MNNTNLAGTWTAEMEAELLPFNIESEKYATFIGPFF